MNDEDDIDMEVMETIEIIVVPCWECKDLLRVTPYQPHRICRVTNVYHPDEEFCNEQRRIARKRLILDPLQDCLPEE